MEGGGWEEKVDLEKQESGENSGFKKNLFRIYSNKILHKSYLSLPFPDPIGEVIWSRRAATPQTSKGGESIGIKILLNLLLQWTLIWGENWEVSEEGSYLEQPDGPQKLYYTGGPVWLKIWGNLAKLHMVKALDSIARMLHSGNSKWQKWPRHLCEVSLWYIMIIDQYQANGVLLFVNIS